MDLVLPGTHDIKIFIYFIKISTVFPTKVFILNFIQKINLILMRMRLKKIEKFKNYKFSDVIIS